jgi:hypothetical protein
MTTQIQPVNPASQIETRLDRLKVWHSGAKASAARLKLFVFLAGAEITALKDCFDVRPGPKTSAAPGNGETVSLIGETVSLCSASSPWKDLISEHVGMTYRTARNYEVAYLEMIRQLPDLGQRILNAVDIRLESSDQQPLALQLKFDDQLQRIKPGDLESFTEATDPWSLSELYKRELKPAEAQEVLEKVKQKAARQAHDTQLEFWFGEVAAQIKRKEYLRLPRNHREMLLDELELAVRELKASLKGAGQ